LNNAKNVNLGEPKDMALGKGIMPFREGFVRWQNMGNTQDVRVRKPRVYQKRRSLGNQSLIFGSFWIYSRDLETTVNTLDTKIIKSLGRGKRFGKMVEIRVCSWRVS
jgi:hypothetical protein